MKKLQYIIYVVLVVVVTVIAGAEDPDARDWEGGTRGRSGWNSSGGHK